MKAFIVLALVCSAVAIPQRGGGGGRGRRPAKQQKKKDPETAIRCWAENFGNEQIIKDCITCFTAEFDLTAQSGLDEAKACATQYWPKGVAACQPEISGMQPGNMESLETVLDCFDDRLETANADRCLSESTATDVQGKMTEGAVCVLDSWKMAFGAVKNMTQGGGRRRGGRRQGGRGGRGGDKKGMKKMFWKTMVDAHCDLASNDDAAKGAECKKCFADAMPKREKLTGGRGQGGRGGRRRGRRAADPAILTNITKCSRSQLSPMYDECTSLMEAGTDMKGATKCYNKVLVRSIVADCVEENTITTAEPNDLTRVVECGVENVFEWLQENNPKAAMMMGKFLKKMGVDDEDESA